ncbi:BatD family protein [Pseudohongiella spirulinae]|nr:BatD family protein [Pseudohongiella spirulinae]
MRQQLTCVLGLVMALLVGLAQAQQPPRVDTSIDRTEITRGETVTVTVRVHGQQGGVRIELEPLRENFEIVSTRSASHLRSVNNRIESWTDYDLVLFPRELGEQQVPALEVAGTTTQSYTITVNEPSGAGLGGGQEIYLETVISDESVYVQEQLLFTIRLYYTIAGIRNPNFTEVEPDNALVQLLGQPHQYEQLIDGIRYGVYEKNYVIFPQRSGELVIPDIVFRGELTDGSSNFVFRNPNMRPVTAFATGYRVDVNERPTEFPSEDNTWLPAKNIQISETWSRDITTLEPGDAVKRTITIVADGLDGPALPPLATGEEIARMNVYPEAPVIERRVIDGNVVGSRTETYELVATGEGSVVIPEINLPWWDTEADELRNAQIPASLIRVNPVGGAVAAQSEADGDEAAENNGLAAFVEQDELLSSARTPVWIINLMSLVIVLVLAGMWWLWRRRLAAMTAAAAAAAPTYQRSEAYAREIEDSHEQQSFADLSKSISQADPQQIRLHLIAWGRQYFHDAGLYNLDDLARHLDNATIRQSFTHLQAAMYSAEDARNFDQSQRQQLQSLISDYRDGQAKSRRLEKQQAPYVLPPLYRN